MHTADCCIVFSARGNYIQGSYYFAALPAQFYYFYVITGNGALLNTYYHRFLMCFNFFLRLLSMLRLL
jgi:hypothetical protein